MTKERTSQVVMRNSWITEQLPKWGWYRCTGWVKRSWPVFVIFFKTNKWHSKVQQSLYFKNTLSCLLEKKEGRKVIILKKCCVCIMCKWDAGLYASFLKGQEHQGIFSLVKGTLWGNCKYILEYFKGTKAMTRGTEAIAFLASVNYQAWGWHLPNVMDTFSLSSLPNVSNPLPNGLDELNNGTIFFQSEILYACQPSFCY